MDQSPQTQRAQAPQEASHQPAPPASHAAQRQAPPAGGMLGEHAARMDLYFRAKDAGVIWIPGAVAPQRSADISKLGPALLIFQKETGKALKDTKNPHFGSKYADLASIKDASGDALDAAGVKYNELLMQIGGKDYLYSEMVHPESGQFIASTEVLLCREQNNPQAHGSALTYARRYNMSTIMSIVADDDDGNAAAGNDKRRGDRGEDERRNFRGDDRPPAQAQRQQPQENRPAPPPEDTIQAPTAPPRGPSAKALWALLEKSPVASFGVEHIPQMHAEIVNCAKIALQSPDASPEEAVMAYVEVLGVAHAHIGKMKELGDKHWGKLRAQLIYIRAQHIVTHKLPGHEKMAEYIRQRQAAERRV